MTRTILVAIAFALAGCASIDPRNPKVFVYTDAAADCKARKAVIVVNQEPIYFFMNKGEDKGKPFLITWHLETRGYSFVKQLTMADPTPVDKRWAAGEISNCRADGRNMMCTNRNQNSGYWKYTLSVKADDDCRDPEPLDPIIGNS